MAWKHDDRLGVFELPRHILGLTELVEIFGVIPQDPTPGVQCAGAVEVLGVLDGRQCWTGQGSMTYRYSKQGTRTTLHREIHIVKVLHVAVWFNRHNPMLFSVLLCALCHDSQHHVLVESRRKSIFSVIDIMMLSKALVLCFSAFNWRSATRLSRCHGRSSDVSNFLLGTSSPVVAWSIILPSISARQFDDLKICCTSPV